MNPETQRKSPVLVQLPKFGISAFISRHGPNFRMPFMRDAYHNIALIDEGAGYLDYEDRSCALQAGTLVRIPPHILHRFVDTPDAPMTLYMVCINEAALHTPDHVRTLWEDVTNSWDAFTPSSPLNSYLLGEYKRLLRCMLIELGEGKKHKAAKVYALVVQFLILTHRNLSRQQPLRDQDVPEEFLASIGYLDDHFTQPIQIDELADRANMSYRTYTSYFRKHKGMTVTQYLNQRRIDFAKRRLQETGDITGTAFEAGFGDLSHFYRIFKRVTGETPGGMLG